MNRYCHLTFIIFISLIFISCSGKKQSPDPDDVSTNVETKEIELTSLDSSQILHEEPFYELGKSIEDILRKISQLENRVLDYEDRLPTTTYTEKLKRLIDGPIPKQKISLKNESVIEGTIEKEMDENIMVMTKVGKLTIKKDEIASIENISDPMPDIIFVGHGQKQVFESYHLFTGKVLNQGNRRGDFVQVIYKLWGENTQIINSDSAFVSGNPIKYNSGIVTDTALKPNKSARFNVQVPIDSEIPVSYITREVNWLIYN